MEEYISPMEEYTSPNDISVDLDILTLPIVKSVDLDEIPDRLDKDVAKFFQKQYSKYYPSDLLKPELSVYEHTSLHVKWETETILISFILKPKTTLVDISFSVLDEGQEVEVIKSIDLSMSESWELLIEMLRHDAA